MPDSYLKKLITAFLVLAAAASSSSLLFINLVPSSPSASESAESKGIRTAPIGQNAFVEQLPTLTANPSATSSAADDGLPPITPTENLTESFAQHLTREMVVENPEGPQVNDDGLTLNVPENIDAIVSQIAAASPELKTAIEQEARVTISDQDILVASDYTAEDIAVYADAINTIINKNLVQSRIKAVLRDAPTANALNALSVLLDLTVVQTKKLSVPASFVPFQKSLLEVLTYLKNALVLANNRDDPLKASLVLEASAQHYDQAINQFYVELQKARSPQDVSGAAQPNKFSAALENVFPLKVKTAHAFLGIGDISFDPALIGREIWEFTRRVLLEILKDRIIHQLVQQIINWVQGNGKPQFITNWRAFLGDAVNVATGDIIGSSRFEGLCSSFGPLIRLNLRSTFLAEQPITCTLEQVVQNVEDFYNDFSQGGWIGYGALVLPSGNYFGSLYETSLIVAQKAQEAKEAAQNEAVAAQGYLNQKTCSKFEWRETGGEDGTLPSRQYVCTEYKTTTPGSTLEKITAAAINSPISRIVNAQEITALTSAFVNAALNKLIQLGQKGILGLSGGSSSTGSPITPPDFSTFCATLDESIAAARRFHDFAVANENQLKSDSENFRVSADATIWTNRAQDASSPVNGLMNTVTGFRDPQWDPFEIQLGRFTNWLDAVITSLIKDEDLDLDGPWDENNPPTQGARGVIRMTDNFAKYLETVKQDIDECENPNPSDLGNIPDPNIGGGGSGGGGGGGGGGGTCSDQGGTPNYAGDLQAALNTVVANNPDGIADQPYTPDNGKTFLNLVAQELQSAGLNATTNVLNGNGNLNPSGDLIGIWRSGDSTVERYDALRSGQPTIGQSTWTNFTGDIPLSCVQ